MKMDMSKLKKMKMPPAAEAPAEEKPMEEMPEESEPMDLGLDMPMEGEEGEESPAEEGTETVGHDLAEVSDEDLMAEIKARGLSAKMSEPSKMAAKKPAPESAPEEMY